MVWGSRAAATLRMTGSDREGGQGAGLRVRVYAWQGLPGRGWGLGLRVRVYAWQGLPGRKVGAGVEGQGLRMAGPAREGEGHCLTRAPACRPGDPPDLDPTYTSVHNHTHKNKGRGRGQAWCVRQQVMHWHEPGTDPHRWLTRQLE